MKTRAFRRALAAIGLLGVLASAQAVAIEVTNLNDSGAGSDPESAILGDLAPGNYTVFVRGVNGTTGVAVVDLRFELTRTATEKL